MGMFEITVKDKKGAIVETISCGLDNCEIGKSRQVLVNLKGWSVAPKHAKIEKTLAGIYVEDISRGYDLLVNGENVERYGPLQETDVLTIGGYTLLVKNMVVESESQDESEGESAEQDQAHAADNEIADVQQDAYMEWAAYLNKELFRLMDLRRMDLDSMGDSELRAQLSQLIDGVMAEVATRIPETVDHDLLKRLVLDEAVGLGPLEGFLADPSITEIMVNSHKDIYIERAGKLERTTINFSSDSAVLSIIERIISPLGRRIDESSPMVDARLADGSRVNAIIAPLSLKGPCLTIRKFADKKLRVDDLVAFDAISQPMATFLQKCVEYRKNVVVSGGTGSGKTTLLNILSNFIPETERVVTVEDAAELQLVQPHVVTLESRPANMEGKGAVPIRDLVKNCLRMRPDRIVVGECRGGEALDMLQAMNTGHDGSLTTGHSNSPRDMVRRLEVMVLMAGMDLPIIAIREQIASAVDLIVQQSRFSDGSRRVTSITEVTGMEGDTIQLNEIFSFKQDGVNSEGKVHGRFLATGRVPEFYEMLRNQGVDPDLSLFSEASNE